MKIILQSKDIGLWYIVNKGPYEDSILDTDLVDLDQKLEMNWTFKTKLISPLMPKLWMFCIII